MLTTVQENVIYRGKIYLKGEQAEIDAADKNLKFFKPRTNAPPIEEEVKLPPLKVGKK